MARRKSFDPAEKLEVAMFLFWRRGYEATSLDHLEAELQLKRFSIYNAFGDKLTLYRDSLKLYLERYFYPAIARLNQANSLVGISEFFNQQIEFLIAHGDCSGCFAFKAAQEVEASEASVAELTQKAQASLLAAFTAALAADQQKGRLTALVDPADSARWLITMYRGLIASDTVEKDQAWMSSFNQQLQQLLVFWQDSAEPACA